MIPSFAMGSGFGRTPESPCLRQTDSTDMSVSHMRR